MKKLNGMRLYASGTQDTLRYIVKMEKAVSRIKRYRIVPVGDKYELYIRRR